MKSIKFLKLVVVGMVVGISLGVGVTVYGDTVSDAWNIGGGWMWFEASTEGEWRGNVKAPIDPTNVVNKNYVDNEATYWDESGEDIYNTNSGNIGIGTTDPSYKLDVADEANFAQPIYIGAPWQDSHAATKSYVDSELGETTTTAEQLYVNEAGDTMSGDLDMDGNDILSLGTLTTDGNLGITGGNVGIGTSTPSVKLEVQGDMQVDSANDICIENGTCLSDVLGGFVQRTAEGTNVVSKSCSGDEKLVNASVQFDGGYQTGFGDINIDYLDDSASVDCQGNSCTLYILCTPGSSATLGYWNKMDSNLYYSSGNVGIGTTDIDHSLDVAGEANFSQPVFVGAPWQDSHAATKNYVDSELQSATSTAENIYVDEAGDTMTGNLNMDGNDIQDLGNLTTSGDLGITGGNVGIGTDSPDSSLHIDATDALRIPAGSTAERPAEITGMMRYNTEINTFEGYDGSNWSGLGGVIDADQNTYIEPETSSGADENTLFFHTDGAEEMRLTTDGRLGIGATDPSYRLDVTGGANFEDPIFVGAPWQDSHAATKNYVDSELQSATSTAENIYVDEAGDTMTGGLGIGYDQPADTDLHVSGKVGIATTTTDSYTLTVDGSIYAHDIYTSGDTFYMDGSPLLSRSEGEVGISADTGEKIDMNIGDTSALHISSGGNVGIGTTSPSHSLDVRGGANFEDPIFVGAPWQDSHAATKNYVDSEIESATTTGIWGTNGDDIYSVNSGNVGIGTTTPSAKLDIAGDGTSTISNAAGPIILDSGGNEVLPGDDATANLGSPSKRWNNIYAASSSVGDLIFANDFRITEAEKIFEEPEIKSIIFQDQESKEIMRLNEDGNLGVGFDSSAVGVVDNVITVSREAETDPIANAWLQYSPETENVLGVTDMNSSEYMKKFKELPVHKWQEDHSKKKLGVLPTKDTPSEILNYDSQGKIEGVDLGGYIGFLHQITKVQQHTLEGVKGFLNISEESFFDMDKDVSDIFSQYLTQAGIFIKDGVISISQKTIFEEGLEVGSPENPQGITIYDQDTGEPYCLQIRSGEISKEKRKCSSR